MPDYSQLYNELGVGQPPERPAMYNRTIFGIPVASEASAKYDREMGIWDSMAQHALEKKLNPISVQQAEQLLPGSSQLASPENYKPVTSLSPSSVPTFSPASPYQQQGGFGPGQPTPIYGPGKPQEVHGPGAPIPDPYWNDTPHLQKAMLEQGMGRMEGPRPVAEGPRPMGEGPRPEPQLSPLNRLYGPQPQAPRLTDPRATQGDTSPLFPSPFQLEQQQGKPQEMTTQQLDMTSPANELTRAAVGRQLNRMGLRSGSLASNDPDMLRLNKEHRQAQINDLQARGTARERRLDQGDRSLDIRQQMADIRNRVEDRKAAIEKELAARGASKADIELAKLQETKNFHRMAIRAYMNNKGLLPEDLSEDNVAEMMSYLEGTPYEAVRKPYGPEFLGSMRPEEHTYQPKAGQEAKVEKPQLSAEQAAKDRDQVQEQARPSPKKGEVVNGYRFLGITDNPNDPKNWEKVSK